MSLHQAQKLLSGSNMELSTLDMAPNTLWRRSTTRPQVVAARKRPPLAMAESFGLQPGAALHPFRLGQWSDWGATPLSGGRS